MGRYRKLYTYSLPIILVLNGYSSGIEGLSIGAVLMNLFNIYALMVFFVNRGKLDKFIVSTTELLLLFFFLSCFSYLIHGISNIHKVFTSSLKIFTWFFGVTFTKKVLFDFSLFKPYYRKFCIICTAYLFLQMISWNGAHIYLPNLFSFGFLKPSYEQYSATAYINYLTDIGLGRFSSFFAEPAYYGILMIINLVIIFFDEYYPEGLSGRAKLESLFLIVGIWFSTSTAAIVFGIFIIAVYFVKTDMSDKFLLLLLSICIGGLLIFVSSTNTLTSFFVEKISTIGTSGRIGRSYAELIKLSPLQRIFGVGLSNEGIITETTYFNVFTGLIIEYGIFGFFFFLHYMYKIYRNVKSIALHVLIIIYLAAMFQGGYLFNLYGIVFFCVALNLRRKELSKVDKKSGVAS